MMNDAKQHTDAKWHRKTPKTMTNDDQQCKTKMRTNDDKWWWTTPSDTWQRTMPNHTKKTTKDAEDVQGWMLLINTEQCMRTNKAKCQMMPKEVKQRLMMPDNNKQHRTMTNNVEKMTNETPNDDEQHRTTQNNNKSYTAQHQWWVMARQLDK